MPGSDLLTISGTIVERCYLSLIIPFVCVFLPLVLIVNISVVCIQSTISQTTEEQRIRGERGGGRVRVGKIRWGAQGRQDCKEILFL